MTADKGWWRPKVRAELILKSRKVFFFPAELSHELAAPGLRGWGGGGSGGGGCRLHFHSHSRLRAIKSFYVAHCLRLWEGGAEKPPKNFRTLWKKHNKCFAAFLPGKIMAVLWFSKQELRKCSCQSLDNFPNLNSYHMLRQGPPAV